MFSKAIVESGSITNLLSPKYSRRIGAATVANLGLTPSRIEEIATVPYDRLLAAYDAAMKTVGNEAREDGAFPVNFLDAILFGQVPVVDGEIIPSLPGTAEALALSKDVPVIIGTVYHEFTRDQEDPIFKPLALQQAQGTAPWAAPTAWRFPSSSTTSSCTAPSRAGETTPCSWATVSAPCGRTSPRRASRPPRKCPRGSPGPP